MPARAPAEGAPASAASAAVEPDLWRRIGFELRMAPDPRHPIKPPLSYFHNSPKFVTRAATQARPFLHYVYTELTRRQLPYEILLLPIIESAYNPAATSPGGAAGIWQFMPATARRFDLHLSRWYDGRRDIVASTTAALDYFEELRDRFMGDWRLVFAAYNCGERTVERAIERNQRLGRRTDFWALDLPRGTREYVPKLIALVEIVAHPAAYGIELPRIPAEPYFDVVDVGGALDLNRVVDWSGMDGQAFDVLNAAFRKRFTVDGAPTLVLVPHGRAARVETMLAALPESERRAARTHVVARGETLSHIASATGVSVAALKAANHLRSNRLAVGQELLVPAPAAALALTAAATPAPRATHVVRNGDNLWDLARHYDTSVAELARLNGLGTHATLHLGQKLRVPGRGAAVAAPAAADDDAAGRHYEVRKGDSLWTISRRFKITVADLKRWNGLSGGALQPGQRLVVAGDAARDI
ncbi:MAG: LysM peptidoglycan-binding domain-containing protein [Gammaproteobacteria bacterium]|nr:LysM peptidoglycan-binding domain-containing protein [Gammaproteobacteria bacterium]